jgi:hypothetical protein
MGRARGDHAVDVDLDFGIVNPLIVVVGNYGRVMHIKGVERNGVTFGSRGGHFGRGLLRGRGFGYCGELCLGGHYFFLVVFGFVGVFFVWCVAVVDVVFGCIVITYAYC